MHALIGGLVIGLLWAALSAWRQWRRFKRELRAAALAAAVHEHRKGELTRLAADLTREVSVRERHGEFLP